MRCLTPFLIIAVMGLCALVGYNTWQINELRSELVSAKVKAHKPEQEKTGKEITQLLDDAKRQTEHARDLISGGKTKNAKSELDQSLQKLEKASRLSRDMAEGAIRGMSGAVDTLKNAFGQKDKPKHDAGGSESH